MYFVLFFCLISFILIVKDKNLFTNFWLNYLEKGRNNILVIFVFFYSIYMAGFILKSFDRIFIYIKENKKQLFNMT